MAEKRTVDSVHRADRAWLLSVQRKLYQWSQKHPEGSYRDLWNWITDPRNLRCAWRRIATNRGRRTPGVDGETVGKIRREQGEETFIRALRRELRERRFRPSPCRRKLIPKRGKPGEFRPLGIPTIKDRVVQCAVKQILEPLFEAQFWHVSYGFRPGRNCHGALEHIRMAIRPRATADDGKRHTMPYRWVIEGDIKSCFDQIRHHQVMQRVRTRVADRRVNRLLVRFLKAGALSDDRLIRSSTGTPQGGVISPLLANIALSAIEERYERWVFHRAKARERGEAFGWKAAHQARATDRVAKRPVYLPVRYCDDFVVLVSGSRSDALSEKKKLAVYLREEMGLELSLEKTRITDLTRGFEFLGHRVRVRWDPRYGYTPRVEIPKGKALELRRRVKRLTRSNRTLLSLSRQLQDLNPVLRGWGNFYRYCTGAKDVFSWIDWYVDERLWRWMRRKHPKSRKRWLMRQRLPATHGNRRVWREGNQEQFIMGRLSVKRYRRGWMRKPDFAITPGELGA